MALYQCNNGRGGTSINWLTVLLEQKPPRMHNEWRPQAFVLGNKCSPNFGVSIGKSSSHGVLGINIQLQSVAVKPAS